MVVVLCVVAVHCFFQPLHYPIYLLHLPLYNLNWEHWRAVYLFYFSLSLITAIALTIILKDNLEGSSWGRRTWATLFGLGAAVQGILIIKHWQAADPWVVLPFIGIAGFGTLCHALLRRFTAAHLLALGACIVVPCLYLPVQRVPFYENPAQVATLPSTSRLFRVMRLIDFEQISHPSAEWLWHNDSVMRMFSRDGMTGYDTALQKNEARMFSCLYSPRLKQLRDSTPLLKYGVQSSIVWPEAEGILTPENLLPRINEARLKLLGVGSLLWKKRIVNLTEPHWDAVFHAWDHLNSGASPVNVLPGTTVRDVAELFSADATETLAARILETGHSAPMDFDDTSGFYRAELPPDTGLLAITCNVGRFYRAYLNGTEIAFLANESLPFLFIDKRESGPAVLELRPQTSGIWVLTAAGIMVGSLCAWA